MIAVRLTFFFTAFYTDDEIVRIAHIFQPLIGLRFRWQTEHLSAKHS